MSSYDDEKYSMRGRANRLAYTATRLGSDFAVNALAVCAASAAYALYAHLAVGAFLMGFAFPILGIAAVGTLLNGVLFPSRMTQSDMYLGWMAQYDHDSIQKSTRNASTFGIKHGLLNAYPNIISRVWRGYVSHKDTIAEYPSRLGYFRQLFHQAKPSVA